MPARPSRTPAAPDDTLGQAMAGRPRDETTACNGLLSCLETWRTRVQRGRRNPEPEISPLSRTTPAISWLRDACRSELTSAVMREPGTQPDRRPGRDSTRRFRRVITHPGFSSRCIPSRVDQTTVPPSTRRSWPVMFLDASDSRNTTASATSAGVLTRPSAVPDRNRSNASSGVCLTRSASSAS